jgi:hypothetical protein
LHAPTFARCGFFATVSAITGGAVQICAHHSSRDKITLRIAKFGAPVGFAVNSVSFPASWDRLTSFIAMPLGNALAGPRSAAYGINPVLVVCGFVLLGSGAAPLLVSGSRRLTRGVPSVAVPEQLILADVRAETTGV